jgi:nucleoside-diphosphate-sugar epimerase
LFIYFLGQCHFIERMEMIMSEQSYSRNTALVLGATGGIGGEVARGLASRGWHVRAMNRDAAKAARSLPGYEWVQGDAMKAGDVLEAARGVSLIVHAVNPPGYKNWGELVLPMLDNTIAAAHAVGARIVLPGTVYNFGPDASPRPTEDSPQNPVTRKGTIRVEMERRLEQAAGSGVPVIIVRAGDYFGPGAANNWFQVLVKAGKPITSIMYPGKSGVGHQWGYLPDVAETMIRLVERGDDSPAFGVYHVEGVWDGDGRQMIAAIERTIGRKVKVRSFPWWMLPFAAPFVTVMRELREMRYLWKEPLRMKNDKLVAALGAEPRTPIDEAVRTTLMSIGCL